MHWRCCIKPKVLWDASSHRVTLFNLTCPYHLSQQSPPRETPLMPTSAFRPLFCTDFNVVAVHHMDGLSNGSEPPQSLWATWVSLICLWHLMIVHSTQALVNRLLNLCSSVSAHLYSAFPDSQIKHFILEHHERLPQQLTYLTVTLHFKERTSQGC